MLKLIFKVWLTVVVVEGFLGAGAILYYSAF